MRIVDMRGPEVRVAGSFAELAASLSGDSVRSLKEFRHNTRWVEGEEKVPGTKENGWKMDGHEN